MIEEEHVLMNCVSAVRFLDLIKPFLPLLPEVASPETKIPFNQKLMWTGVSWVIQSSTGRLYLMYCVSS